MRAQMAAFRSALEAFALAHRAAIRADPAFRARFHAMCASCGVDPLCSNKGAWNRLLGFGDFYYELAVQAAEACLASRPLNGGLLELSSLHQHVSVRGCGWAGGAAAGESGGRPQGAARLQACASRRACACLLGRHPKLAKPTRTRAAAAARLRRRPRV
jgi:hypothetical protein